MTMRSPIIICRELRLLGSDDELLCKMITLTEAVASECLAAPSCRTAREPDIAPMSRERSEMTTGGWLRSAGCIGNDWPAGFPLRLE